MNLYRVLTLTLESGVGLSGIKAWSSLHVKFDLLFYEKITVYQRKGRVREGGGGGEANTPQYYYEVFTAYTCIEHNACMVRDNTE